MNSLKMLHPLLDMFLARTPYLLLALFIGLAGTSQANAQGLFCIQTPIITSFTANPATIVEGSSTTLSWSGFLLIGGSDICAGASNFNPNIGFRFGPTFANSPTGVITSGDGQMASGNSATFVYELPGTYTPTVTATFTWIRPSLTVDLLTNAIIDSHIDNFSQTVTQTTKVTVLAVPEPESCALLVAGLGFMGFAVGRIKAV